MLIPVRLSRTKTWHGGGGVEAYSVRSVLTKSRCAPDGPEHNERQAHDHDPTGRETPKSFGATDEGGSSVPRAFVPVTVSGLKNSSIGSDQTESENKFKEHAPPPRPRSRKWRHPVPMRD